MVHRWYRDKVRWQLAGAHSRAHNDSTTQVSVPSSLLLQDRIFQIESAISKIRMSPMLSLPLVAVRCAQSSSSSRLPHARFPAAPTDTPC